MRQKSRNGFNSIGLLVMTAIILIIVAIMVLPTIHRSSFKEYFGLTISWNSLNDEERQTIQPFVTKRLQELRNNLHTAQKEKADFLNLPLGNVTPEETTQRINKLREIKAKINYASDALERAEGSAKYFRFKP